MRGRSGRQVYADAERVGEGLVRQIIVPTETPAAASAFASILCSPSHTVRFCAPPRFSPQVSASDVCIRYLQVICKRYLHQISA